MTLQQDLDRVTREQPAEYGFTSALVVQRAGEVLAESYGPDTDASTQLLSWSMAKSFTHALTGILVGSGELGLDIPAPVPEWQRPDDPRARITLDNLLRMNSGLHFVEDYVDDGESDCLQMLFGTGRDDMAAFAAAQPLEGEPGRQVNYASGTTNIISRMLAAVVGSGRDFEAWANEVLFGPLGIENPLFGFDGAGTWVGSSYLHVTARDFAAFGQLYLDDGLVGSTQLLAPSWVEHATTVTGPDEDGKLYGAHWWISGEQPGVFSARGYDTQRILVWPAEEIVVVRLGKTPVELADNVDSWLGQVLDDAANG